MGDIRRVIRPNQKGRPAMGQPTEPTTPPAEPAPAEPTDDGKGGKSAVLADLAKERDARQALEKQLAEQGKQIDALQPLKDLAAALGVKPDTKGGKTDVQALTEQVEAMKKQQADAELRAMRLEVAAEKGLTPAQAARLSGSTRDELATDADALKALFPGTTPGTPQPDPSQGSRGNAGELEAQLAKAVADKNVGEQVRIKTALAASKTQ